MFRQSKLNFPVSGTPDQIHDLKSREIMASTLYFTQNETMGRGERSRLPPAAPSSALSNTRTPTATNWSANKSGKKSLADFSNERNVVTKSDIYFKTEKSDPSSKFRIVRKLTNTRSAVKLRPINSEKEITDSSLESSSRNIKSSANIQLKTPSVMETKALTKIKPNEISFVDKNGTPGKARIKKKKNKQQILGVYLISG